MGIVSWARKKSPWVFHFPAGGGCNGCDIEVLASMAARFDPERVGMRLMGSPRHADVLLINGAVTKKNVKNLKRVYDQVPEPKVVVAVGNCALSGECFRNMYPIAKPLDTHLTVDIYVPGCPPRPQAILAAILRALEKKFR